MFSVLLLLLLVTHIHPSTIFPNNTPFKCPGNFQQLQGKCVPCKYGTVSLNGRCVALDLSFTYGSNAASEKKIDINCEPNRFFFGVCLKCKSGFYLDEKSRCQDQALCEIFDLSSYACLKKIDQEMPTVNSTQPETGNTTTGYVLSKQQQTKSIQTTFKSSQLQLTPISSSDVPSLFLPLPDTQQPQVDKVIYFIHESGGQLTVSINICEIPNNNKTCECLNYFYNGVSGKCIKAIDKLILSANMEYQIVDPYCLQWKIKQQTQKYICSQCAQNSHFEDISQRCIKIEEEKCIVFSEENNQICIECGQSFVLDGSGKCIE